MKLIVKIFTFLLAGITVAILALLVWFYIATKDSALSDEKLTLSSSTMSVYGADGALLCELSSQKNREIVPLEEMPAHLPNAFVAVEDKRFYTHGGLEYGRMIKAACKNLLALSFREGASTISQQLVKNTHLSGEKTLNRKLKEIKLTKRLEKRYSKKQIIELYLNSIYFGHSAFGLSQATRYYFGKSASELSPAESATLAALVKSPNRYSPFQDTERCVSRRNFVLSKMLEQGFLSQAEYDAAIKAPLPTTPFEENDSAYFSLVYADLGKIFPDASAQELRGLKIYTAYEPKLQTALQEISAESDYCFLVRDNQTHAIKAISSTCGTPLRLPASTIKPLLVYAPAVEEGELSPATPVLDEEVNYNGYRPSNYGGGYGGYMSARYALSHSVNVPAVKILNELGCERAVKYLDQMNLTVPKEDYSLALALGGMKRGFTLPALADGYATLANGGEYTPSHVIERIQTQTGKTVYEAKNETRRVFAPSTAALVNDMLRTAVLEGTAKKLRPLQYEVCAKTGTGANAGENLDAYTLAYTTEDTVAVWLGNADNSPVRATGGGAPADCALKIFRALYAEKPPAPFPAEESVQSVALDKLEYERDHRLVLADTLSPPANTFHELFAVAHTPTAQSTRFSCPTIEKPRIFVRNGAVIIELCHAEYYEYLIKRTHKGQSTVVYQGKYQKTITDNSVTAGEKYEYCVQPVYRERVGEAVALPSVLVPKRAENADCWWD